MKKRNDANEQRGFEFAGQGAIESDNSDFVADSIGEVWPADLTRRLRVLLHTLPLDGVRRGDAIRDTELRHYDGLALALRVLDLVIDRLGLEAEADREAITRVLGPALSAMDAAAGLATSPERHDHDLQKTKRELADAVITHGPF